VPIACGRYIAEHITGARLLEVDNGPHLNVKPGRPRRVDAFEEQVTGHLHEPDIDRVLATVLFTDIVSSTELATERGDANWSYILDRHDDAARHAIDRYRGVQVRAGAHTGEVELRGDDIGGIAVHIASRVASLAGPGEVLVSRTVKDLTAGSGITFHERGEHALKGVADPWHLFAAVPA
jgi:class 3 adenylate cyclase